jgi:hypothetical protein
MTTMEPSPEQISNWLETATTVDGLERANLMQVGSMVEHLARLAYAAGAGAQLRRCVEWVGEEEPGWAVRMEHHMRSKPPSLKQQAMEAYELLVNGEDSGGFPVIREALESLPDD